MRKVLKTHNYLIAFMLGSATEQALRGRLENSIIVLVMAVAVLLSRQIVAGWDQRGGGVGCK